MQALELKIPPPVVAGLTAGAMCGLSLVTPLFDVPALLRVSSAGTLALAGVGFILTGVLSFHRARTTINPMKPDTTSALVCSGIYRVTRNPMYAGLLFILVAWAVFLSSVWALLGPVAFVCYINRFQIVPEERALAALFGTSYAAYTACVRRWM